MFNPSDICADLPDIFNLEAKVIFPVNYGTEVGIGCISGYGLTGDNVITCVKDRTFSFGTDPECILST